MPADIVLEVHFYYNQEYLRCICLPWSWSKTDFPCPYADWVLFLLPYRGFCMYIPRKLLYLISSPSQYLINVQRLMVVSLFLWSSRIYRCCAVLIFYWEPPVPVLSSFCFLIPGGYGYLDLDTFDNRSGSGYLIFGKEPPGLCRFFAGSLDFFPKIS